MSKEMRSKPDNSWKYMLAITGIITIAVIILSVQAGLNPSGAGKIINSLSGNVSAEAAELLSKAEFAPPALCGFIINPQSETNYFDFVLDTGDDAVVDKEKLTPETKELINYFFLGITLPAREFWVNLNPVELNSIISPMLICTGLGKMLLETDLRLKRDAAMLTDPRLPCGKEYWDVLKAELNEKNLSNVQIPANTRLWIIPADAVIEEDKDNADKVILVGAKLKVCLESEYDTDLSVNGNTAQSEEDKKIQDIASQAMKKVILPIIEFRVNYSKDYAQLRQIYQSLILAEYFKHKYWGKQSIYESYINTCSIGELESKEGWSKEAMFDSYVQSMTKGEYSCIQQEYDPAQAAMIKRHYFSGGMQFGILPAGFGQSMTPIGPGVVSSGIGGPGDLIAQATTGAGAGGKVVVEDIKLLTPEEAEAQRTAASPVNDDAQQESEPKGEMIKVDADITALAKGLFNVNAEELRSFPASVWRDDLYLVLKQLGEGRLMRGEIWNIKIEKLTDETRVQLEERAKEDLRHLRGLKAAIQEEMRPFIEEIENSLQQELLGQSKRPVVYVSNEKIEKLRVMALDLVNCSNAERRTAIAEEMRQKITALDNSEKLTGFQTDSLKEISALLDKFIDIEQKYAVLEKATSECARYIYWLKSKLIQRDSAVIEMLRFFAEITNNLLLNEESKDDERALSRIIDLGNALIEVIDATKIEQLQRLERNCEMVVAGKEELKEITGKLLEEANESVQKVDEDNWRELNSRVIELVQCREAAKLPELIREIDRKISVLKIPDSFTDFFRDRLKAIQMLAQKYAEKRAVLENVKREAISFLRNIVQDMKIFVDFAKFSAADPSELELKVSSFVKPIQISRLDSSELFFFREKLENNLAHIFILMKNIERMTSAELKYFENGNKNNHLAAERRQLIDGSNQLWDKSKEMSLMQAERFRIVLQLGRNIDNMEASESPTAAKIDWQEDISSSDRRENVHGDNSASSPIREIDTSLSFSGATPSGENDVGGVDLRKIRYRVVFSEG